jgi:glycosyltransferase involved in cell wall biosynthesis
MTDRSLLYSVKLRLKQVFARARQIDTTLPLRVCFLSLSAHPVFRGTTTHDFGGAEVRAATFARGLACLPGVFVSFIVHDHGQRKCEHVDGIAVVRSTPPYVAGTFSDRVTGEALTLVKRIRSFPWVKVVKWHPRLLWQVPVAAARIAWIKYHWHRLTSLVSRSHDADVVCCFGVNEASARAIIACRRRHRKAVLFIASDHEVNEAAYYKGSCEQGAMGEPGGLCFEAIKEADSIVVQTLFQQEQLRTRFGRESSVIRNPIDLSDEIAPYRQSNRPVALWIGRAEAIQKRPHLCVELAVRCPEIPFVIVMSRTDPLIYDNLVKSAPSNVRIIGHVPFAEMANLFDSARVYLSTSLFEGFPNAFLQAAKHGVPILSLDVDPGGMLTTHRCGHVANGNIDVMVRTLRELWNDSEAALRISKSARSYVEANHDVRQSVERFQALLSALAGPDAA